MPTERIPPLEPDVPTERIPPLEPDVPTERIPPLEPDVPTERIPPLEPDVPNERILPLELHDVGVVRGSSLLLDVPNVRLAAGGPTLILGPNGAGKSLLLRVCHGLLTPDRGRVVWHGRLANEAALHQAMVLQRPVLLRRSVAANLDYALRVRGTPKSERMSKTEEVLTATGLLALADRSARSLSVGEQQRLALARAWALDPEVLFLDEPTASVDPGAAHRLEQAIRAISAGGTKIVMSCHDLRLAERIASEVLFLHRGRLLEVRTGRDFFGGTSSPEAQAFLRGELSW